jgi:hypothetical protein
MASEGERTYDMGSRWTYFICEYHGMLQAVIEIDNKPGSQVHFDKFCTFIATHEQKLELYS